MRKLGTGHYIPMKNITLRAEEGLIEQARRVARAQRTTLNAAFRKWLQGVCGVRWQRRRHRCPHAPFSGRSVVRSLQSGRDGRAVTRPVWTRERAGIECSLV